MANPILLGLVAAPGVPFPDAAGDGLDGWEGPDYATSLWDLAVLNGQKVPGFTEVECIPKKKIKIPKATGRDGGPTTDRGHEAARLSITIRVYTPSQWQKLQVLLRSIWRPPGAPLGAFDMKGVTIEHPACSTPPWSVTAILIESLESPKYTAGKEMVVRIKALQYIEAKAASVSRSVKGKGKVPVTKEFEQSRGVAPARPSTTDAVPRLPPTPTRGTAG